MVSRSALLLVFVVLASGCSKHKDPGFTSAEGTWTYTTPDSKIVVTFDLVKSSPGYDVKNQTLKVDGTAGNSALQTSGVGLTTIEKIRINANDSKLTYPYSIEFDNGTVSSDYKSITFATATYTWPFGTSVPLTSVKVSRQP